MDWFDMEVEALGKLLADGIISRDEYVRDMMDLCRAAQEQEDRDEIIAAGRGHLLRDR